MRKASYKNKKSKTDKENSWLNLTFANDIDHVCISSFTIKVIYLHLQSTIPSISYGDL